MNPVERAEAAPVNPFVQRAEAARMVAEALVMPSTHVNAAEVAGEIGSLMPVRHRGPRQRPSRRRVIVFWALLITAESALLVWIWAPIIAGGAS